MNQDGFIEEEAIIDARLETQTSKQSHQRQDSRGADIDETTGLLNEQRQDEDDSREPNVQGQNGAQPAWHGDADFEGLPWHKRPSV